MTEHQLQDHHVFGNVLHFEEFVSLGGSVFIYEYDVSAFGLEFNLDGLIYCLLTCLLVGFDDHLPGFNSVVLWIVDVNQNLRYPLAYLRFPQTHPWALQRFVSSRSSQSFSLVLVDGLYSIIQTFRSSELPPVYRPSHLVSDLHSSLLILNRLQECEDRAFDLLNLMGIDIDDQFLNKVDELDGHELDY